ncbi:MAG TPA: hypothetical protein VML57_19990 [Burkholderiales bacterium]|nr:hypothetical protein [Burkholderiales bacterium]
MSFAAAHFGMFAAYNAWANERLYAACARRSSSSTTRCTTAGRRTISSARRASRRPSWT